MTDKQHIKFLIEKVKYINSTIPVYGFGQKPPVMGDFENKKVDDALDLDFLKIK